MRDFLEGRRGRGSTARRNPAVTHGRIELFIVMAGCSASLCVGVGRVRGPPVRGRILSLLLPLSAIILPLPPPPYSRSILSSRRWTLVSTNTDTERGGLSAPIYNTAALFLQLSRARPPPFLPPSLLPAIPLASSSFSRRPSPSSSLLTRGPSATCATGRPLPVYGPRWVSNTYLHGRGTTVSVPGQLLTRSTHRDCPRAPPWTTGTTH